MTETETAQASDSVARGVDEGGPLAVATARGVAWVASARLASQFFQFAASLVLARLLLPSAYGLVSITWAFSGFALILCDMGLAAALVQRPRMTRADASTAFAMNLLVGFALTGLLIALSRPIADLFDQPRLAALLMVASIGFSISATTVPMAILEREMRFAAAGALDVGSAVLGLVISIGCALAGLGAVSLVIGPIAGMGLSTVGSFAATRWYPQTPPTVASARALIRFAGHVMGYNVFAYWAVSGDNLMVGAVVGPTALGFYNRAYSLMMLPVLQVTSVIGRVLLPVLSAINGDLPRLRRAFLRMSRTVCTVMFPLSLGLVGVAHTFVPVAFGPHWRGAIPLVMLLAAAGVPQVIAALSSIVCQAAGQPRLLTTWGNLNNASILAAVALGLPWHAVGVAAAFTIRAYLLLPLAVLPARRTIGVSTRDIARVARTPLGAALGMAGAMILIGVLLEPRLPIAVVLVVQVLAGSLLYVAAMRVFDRAALVDAYRMLRFRSVAA